MRVTQVALCPTQASDEAGRPALTPELLAATGARYSRSNEGLEAILAKIDPQNPDKSVDSIFRMVDYGHASIADMAPVAMFLDGVTMWLAYYVWSLCPTAGGQESSTRYIRLSPDNLPSAEEIGIPEQQRAEWQSAMESALAAYEQAVAFWEDVAHQNPEVMRIPKALLNDDSDKAQKQVARMRRNYAFDRARYFIPAALRTNVMLVMSARAWVTLCQQLLSHPLAEAQKLGDLIRTELELAAPRLLKHAEAKETWQKGVLSELAAWSSVATGYMAAGNSSATEEASDLPMLEVFPTDADTDFTRSLEFHSNRYAYIGTDLQRTPVRFGWNAVALGDIRDLNRHRTGSKWCPLVPKGFYGARDQIEDANALEPLLGIGGDTSQAALSRLQERDWTFVYWTLLGTQFQFEHVTTANQFIYEGELRTGLGAHYRYAKHLHDVLELWYEKFPETRGLILEGSGEPE
jgi:thymidylate synthase ThyX